MKDIIVYIILAACLLSTLQVSYRTDFNEDRLEHKINRMDSDFNQQNHTINNKIDALSNSIMPSAFKRQKGNK